jgi:hypothetical protein
MDVYGESLREASEEESKAQPNKQFHGKIQQEALENESKVVECSIS